MERRNQVAGPGSAQRPIKIFSYVVKHDEGLEPNPYFSLCTLCRCKFSKKAEATQGLKGRRNIVELAGPGDWVIGTGGESVKSAGHGKLIYAMLVDERPTRWDYFTRFKERKPECPHGDFQKHKQFALVSRYFYYFGANAIDIPERFKHFQKKGPGFRYVDPVQFRSFLEWLTKTKKPSRGNMGSRARRPLTNRRPANDASRLAENRDR
jgi:hypothetical protein